MSKDAAELKESEVPLFNIIVQLPLGIDPAIVRQRAIGELGIRPEKIDAVLHAVKGGARVKIGSAVPQDKAEEVRSEFSRAGLQVDLQPVLSVQAIKRPEADNTFVCPACEERIVLTDQRQCPSCGVFVDKVTPEMLLRRKIMKEERVRAQSRATQEARDGAKRAAEELEKALRDKIRKELEEEFGLKQKPQGLFSGKAGAARAVGAVVMLAAAGALGRFSHSGPQVALEPAQSSVAAGAGTGPQIDKMMTSIDEPGIPADATPSTEEPLGEDSLMTAAVGGNVTGKGLSVEQAIVAAGALAHGAASGGADPASAATGPSAANPSAAVQSGTPATEAAPLPKAAKLDLTIEFATQLAELGQAARGREILQPVQAAPEAGADPGLAARARLASLELQAWSVGGQRPGRARQEVEALKAEVAKLGDGAERATAFARTGAILARHTVLPREAGNAFLMLGGETLKTLAQADVQRIAMDEWLVAMGEALLADLAQSTARGRWNRAQDTYRRFSGIAAQATSPQAAAQMGGLDYRARTIMGQTDTALSALDTALIATDKAGDLADQARALRRLARSSGQPDHPRIRDAASKLQQAKATSDLERARLQAELAVWEAEVGQAEASARLRDAARQAVDVRTPQGASVSAEAIVRTDLALARARHGAGMFSETESLLRRVADYLL